MGCSVHSSVKAWTKVGIHDAERRIRGVCLYSDSILFEVEEVNSKICAKA